MCLIFLKAQPCKRAFSPTHLTTFDSNLHMPEATGSASYKKGVHFQREKDLTEKAENYFHYASQVVHITPYLHLSMIIYTCFLITDKVSHITYCLSLASGFCIPLGSNVLHVIQA